MTVVEWQKQREQRAKAARGRPEQRVTCVWISSLMERFVSCFFFTASRSTKGRMVMPWGGEGELHLCPRHSGGSGMGSAKPNHRWCHCAVFWGHGTATGLGMEAGDGLPTLYTAMKSPLSL